MRKAFIVMAYKDPQQIERLVKRMNDDSFHFYIHVDKKSDRSKFDYLKEYDNVFLTKVCNKINWAGYSFTQTLISCIDEVLSKEYRYDFISSFSGQDYPIKTNEEIVSFFDSNKASSFFSLADQDSDWHQEARQRYQNYHMTDFGFKGRYLFQKFINKVVGKRDFNFFDKVYGGPRATWWTMSSEAASYVSSFFKSNAELRRFVKFTWAPDEFLIPSILMNSSHKENVVLDGLRYIDWSGGGCNPKIFDASDFEALCTTDKLFARKFDFKVDTKILDQLDEKLN